MKSVLARIQDDLHSDISKIADENGSSINMVIEQALKYYRDFFHMQNKATFINEQITAVIQADHDLLVRQLNHKTNQVLSELAIQTAIQNQLLAEELDVDDLHISDYRKKAIEFLSANNRVLRLDELAK